MKLFAGKTPTERNKIIAAIVLGVLSLFSLWMAFGGSIFSSKTTVTATASPTPKSSVSPNANRDDLRMPSADELTNVYSTIPVVHDSRKFFAPDAGRNIFAFYEPPPPTPYSPTPTPEIVIKTPTPVVTPTPPYLVSYIQPQSVYAGAKAFRLEVNGDKFTPDARIYFNGSAVPTTFVDEQKVVADIPANFIAGEGEKQILVQSPDGKFYSLPVMLNVQAPPQPQVEYVGMIGRRGYNNDTAVFREKGKPAEFSARLTDVIGGRFRVFSISPSETIVEDVNLGFKHRIPLYRPAPGTSSSISPSGSGRGRGSNDGFSQPGTYVPYNPNNNVQQQQNIPGIPNNIPRYVPPQPQQPQPPQTPQRDKKEEDDEDGDGNR